MSDPFSPDDSWGEYFDDVDTEDFGPWPACLDPYIPGDTDDGIDWESIITKHTVDEMAREIDQMILDDLLADGLLAPAPQSLSSDDLTGETLPDLYPHRCPRCGGRAYVGMSNVDCEAKCGA